MTRCPDKKDSTVQSSIAALKDALLCYMDLYEVPYVYFILAPDSKRVKIGKATNVESRLSTLQIGSAEKLSLLAALPCGWLEKKFHRYFSDERVSGEWFAITPRLWSFIEAIIDGTVEERLDRLQKEVHKDPVKLLIEGKESLNQDATGDLEADVNRQIKQILTAERGFRHDGATLDAARRILDLHHKHPDLVAKQLQGLFG